MSEFQLAVFEDEESVRQLIRDILRDSAYEVGAEAVTRREAFNVVDALYAGELSVHAVLLDGNLDNADNVLFSDAHAIYNKMHELELVTPIVGISTDELRTQGVPIQRSLDITKWGLVQNLVPTLDTLVLSSER